MTTLPFPHALPARQALNRVVVLTAMLGGALVSLAGCARVDPTFASVGAPVLDRSLPTDLDRFSIGGDLGQVANCQGHIIGSAQTRYGDALDVAGGDVQGYGTRDYPIRFEARRGDNGHWVITRSDATPLSASLDEFQAQVKTCTIALQDKLDGAVNRLATQARNQASWSTPSHG